MLFGDQETIKRQREADFGIKSGQYFVERLKTVFSQLLTNNPLLAAKLSKRPAVSAVLRLLVNPRGQHRQH